MGLAGPKESKKIGKDPRNTFWSNDTSRFGHQYLANLGWTPGQTLGDSNSSYHKSGHITAASSTGVKIQIKDDNLGIGAKKGAQEDECVGLLGLQGLLGRLNGNTEQVERVQEMQDRKKNELIESKFGMRFVRGEVWVADDLTKLRERMLKDKAARENAQKKLEAGDKDNSDEDGGKRKKRKRDDAEEDSAARKRRKEERRLKREAKEARRKEKKEKKEKKKEKKDKKDKKQKAKKSSSDSDSSSDSESEAEKTVTKTSTPAYNALNGRHAIRARFIAAKKSAMMDAASLNEIFMIKA
ncbi:hypothetical protein BZA77DRAFT_335289 [Pyronema omphalodes]|nr:hypothetical protein BZA77DRAFT_335289 [Pyronema omphalodes]